MHDGVPRRHHAQSGRREHNPHATTMSEDRIKVTKVFGIGWAKTGTTTLGHCLRRLGYDHYGQNLHLVERMMAGCVQKAMQIAAARQSFEDWPWILLFRELDAAFPGSRFILTTRDADRWIASYRAMVHAEGPPTPQMASIRAFIYGMDVAGASDEQLKARYCRHNADVLEHFKGRPQCLLVVDWERGDGWRELCEFLGAVAPEEPFPHLNRRA
jgi:hypothetical protein